jgi:hypothetical protein
MQTAFEMQTVSYFQNMQTAFDILFLLACRCRKSLQTPFDEIENIVKHAPGIVHVCTYILGTYAREN